MNVDAAIRAALVEALGSPEGQAALRRALGQARTAATGDDQTYSVAQLAKLSGYKPESILQRITSGDLRASKPRGCREWRILREDYRAWLADSGEREAANDLDPEEVARKMLSGGR